MAANVLPFALNEGPIAALLSDRDFAPVRRQAMELSARNQLRGTITDIKLDGLMAEVTVAIGEQEIVSVITRGSAERLGLRQGDAVTVIFKSTEVMLAK
jgi:molybdopterin-binding protein